MLVWLNHNWNNNKFLIPDYANHAGNGDSGGGVDDWLLVIGNWKWFNDQYIVFDFLFFVI